MVCKFPLFTTILAINIRGNSSDRFLIYADKVHVPDLNHEVFEFVFLVILVVKIMMILGKFSLGNRFIRLHVVASSMESAKHIEEVGSNFL